MPTALLTGFVRHAIGVVMAPVERIASASDVGGRSGDAAPGLAGASETKRQALNYGARNSHGARAAAVRSVAWERWAN